MKYLVKTFLFSLLAVVVFSSCTKPKDIIAPSDGNILIKFVNTTDQIISGAKADNVNIGTIDAGSETGYIAFETFGIDTGMPDTKFNGKLNGSVLGCSSQFLFCGAEKSKLKPGQYTINIRTIDVEGADYFDLQFRH